MRENDPFGVVDSDERFFPPEREEHSYEEDFIDGLLLSMYRAARFEREHGEKSEKAKEQTFTKPDRKEDVYGRKS